MDGWIGFDFYFDLIGFVGQQVSHTIKTLSSNSLSTSFFTLKSKGYGSPKVHLQASLDKMSSKEFPSSLVSRLSEASTLPLE